MSEFESTAVEFVAAAFAVLKAGNAIPTSSLHRHLQRNLDFNAVTIERLPQYSLLADEILEAAPAGMPDCNDKLRFEHTLTNLIFSFLELCVEKCSRAADYDPCGAEVKIAIAQFVEVLSGQPYDIVLTRHVSHLLPAAGNEIEINGIAIVPDDDVESLPDRIVREIPKADHAWNRRPPSSYRPPHTLLIARRQVAGVAFQGNSALTDILDQFQLAVCLLTGANVQGMYQVWGASSAISGQPASLEHLIRDVDSPLVRRTARLMGEEGPALSALIALIDGVKTTGEGIWLSSFDEAMEKFAKLDDTTSHFEQIVQLTTALEGVMIGANEGEGLLFRLCTRVTALLAVEDDPAEVLFEDLKRLYKFRSKIVHGGELTAKQLRGDLNAMSCVPDEESAGNVLVRVGYAVDRLRDIVRRAILARICLAAGDSPLWPFGDEGKAVKLDVVLSNDVNRGVWRVHWRSVLDSRGIGDAAGKANPPVYSLSNEDI